MDQPHKRDWQKASLGPHGLTFEHEDGLERALCDGFFFLRPPEAMDLAPGDRFAQNFYRPRASSTDPDASFRGLSELTSEYLGKHQGYFCRDEDQTEQFFLQSSWWSEVFPHSLVDQAKAMQDLALEVLRAVLVHLDLPRELWDVATGQSVSGQGTYTLTFNHFRPQKNARGLNVHKDSGWVTVLRSLEPGLEAQRNDEWQPVDPIEGMFIVNFGCAMEILTRRTRRPVAAVPHRVVEQPQRDKPDRFSYALFVDSSLDESVCPGLFSYGDSGLQFEARFDDFLETILSNTYIRDGAGLY